MKRIKLLSIIPAALAAPLVLTSLAGAASTNYVTNGDFSQGLTGWDDWAPTKTALTVTPDGMLLIEGKLGAPNFVYDSVAQCLSIPSDEHDYLVEADLLIPAGQARSGWVDIQVQSYVGPCALPSQPVWLGERTYYDDSTVHHASFEVVPAPGSTHLRIKIGVGTSAPSAGQDPNATLEGRFDNVSITADVNDDPPADEPAPPADEPVPPTDDPTPPAGDSTPPADDPTPPAGHPTRPADDPTPPAEHPTPPADDPIQPTTDDPATATPTPAVGAELPAEPDDPQPGGRQEPAAAEPAQGPAEPTATGTPLPPSAGTGTGTGMATSQPANLSLLAGVVLAAFSATTFAVSTAGARMKRR